MVIVLPGSATPVMVGPPVIASGPASTMFKYPSANRLEVMEPAAVGRVESMKIFSGAALELSKPSTTRLAVMDLPPSLSALLGRISTVPVPLAGTGAVNGTEAISVAPL